MSLRRLIRVMREMNSGGSSVRSVRGSSGDGVVVADRYDLRFLSRQDVRGFSMSDIACLLKYARAYIDQCMDQKYLFRGNMADLEESEALRQVRASMALLEEELRRRS